MKKRTIITIILISVFISWIPLLMGAWDKTKCAEGILAPDLNDEIREQYVDLEAALTKEMNFSTGGTASLQGIMKQGSGRCFFQATAPTTRINGSAFAATDNGSLWVDSDDNKTYILTDYSGPTWTSIESVSIATLLAATRTFAEAITFSVAPVFTEGIAANDAYLVGRNNADDGNIDMIKVNTSDGLTLGAVTTLPDTSALATSGAPVADAQIANKKYVDDAASLRCRMYLSSDQSIATGTDTIIQFSTDSYDVDSIGTTGAAAKITPGVAGYYSVTACTRIKLLGDGKVMLIKIFKNTTLSSQTEIASSTVQNYSALTTDVIYLDDDDYIQVKVNHNHGSNLNISGLTEDTYVTLQVVGH